jgi:hypothetical protein
VCYGRRKTVPVSMTMALTVTGLLFGSLDRMTISASKKNDVSEGRECVHCFVVVSHVFFGLLRSLEFSRRGVSLWK